MTYHSERGDTAKISERNYLKKIIIQERKTLKKLMKIKSSDVQKPEKP